MLILNPWGLIGLAALPAVLAIHCFRRTYRPQRISGLFLYGLSTIAPTAGRKRQKLVSRASLYCELLSALALTWYFCDPHWSDQRAGEHLVAVLDSRISLQARAAADADPVEARIRAELDHLIAALDRDDRVTLIADWWSAPPPPPARRRPRSRPGAPKNPTTSSTMP
jgi:hypothetical protein